MTCCDSCGDSLDVVRADARYCSPACRQQAYRDRQRAEGPPQTRTARAELIADLAAQGCSSRQMPAKVGVSEGSVRLIARDYSIEIPADKAVVRTRRLDSTRIVTSIVADLESTQMSLALINFDALDLREADHWVTSLTVSVSALRKLRDRISKEMTQSPTRNGAGADTRNGAGAGIRNAREGR